MSRNFEAGFELKNEYQFLCAKCGHEMWLRPSIVMLMGMNSGHGRCSKCDTFLHLEIKEDNSGAISQVFDEWVKESKGCGDV